MNTITLSLSTVALGTMLGITGTHFQHVNTLVEQGVPVRQVEVAPLESESQSSPVLPVKLAVSDVPVMPPSPSASIPHQNAVLELLAEMRGEQKRMRRQLAETNRDLAEAQFQLDAQSDTFRPLHTEVSNPRSLDTASEPIDDGAGVLPPKPVSTR